MPSAYPLVKEAAKHCWGKGHQNIFKDFCIKHAHKFINAPLTLGEEQNLEYYSLFQNYLELYESSLSSYIETLNVSIEEFYSELVAVKDDPSIKDKKLLHFVNYLLASTDYAGTLTIKNICMCLYILFFCYLLRLILCDVFIAFYKLMIRAAKKLNTEGNIDDEDDVNESKAESKTASTDGRGSPNADHKSESKKYPSESKDSGYK